jgi:lysophospholipase L1-like esterase
MIWLPVLPDWLPGIGNEESPVGLSLQTLPFIHLIMPAKTSLLKPHQVILFQGNSITAAGRDFSQVGPNSPEGLGGGYARKISDHLLHDYPGKHLQFYNRAISGNRIWDLYQRWETDTLPLLPDMISILIGVNDTWNQVMLGLGSTPKEFKDIYRKILTITQQSLPDTRLVLCEPFLLQTGEVTQDWSGDISQRQEIIKDLALEFGGLFVPFQGSLDQEEKHVPPHQLLRDGVHPTDRGHQVLADCWMSTVLP